MSNSPAVGSIARSARRVHPLLLALLVALATSLVLSGCGGDDASKSKQSSKKDAAAKSDPDEGRGDPPPDEPAGPTDEYENVKDPVNGAFTVDVPVGWDNTVYSTGQFSENRQVVTSVSPDELTTIFMGDPKIPSYWNPDGAMQVTIDLAEQLDLMEMRSYTPAQDLLPEYVADKFGELPGFELGELRRNPDLEQKGRDAFAKAGLTAGDIASANQYFTYGEKGSDTRSAMVSMTTIDGGLSWMTYVGGISTTGDVADYEPMLQRISSSTTIDPEYTAKANANHEQVMAQIQANTAAMKARHNANMQWIQNSANAHQQRMQGLWAQADAGMDAYNQRMSAMDSNQRGFLNYVNEEETTASPSGQSFQVDSGYDRYWRNTSDGSYVGGDVNFGESQLREMGLDPSSYEELKIVKP